MVDGVQSWEVLDALIPQPVSDPGFPGPSRRDAKFTTEPIISKVTTIIKPIKPKLKYSVLKNGSVQLNQTAVLLHL